MRPPIALAALSLLLSAACAGGAPSRAGSPMDAAFRAQVDAVCDQALQQHSKRPFPLPSFDPRHPDARQLPVVGAYFAAQGDAGQVVARLDSLGEPSSQAGSWDQLLALAAQLAMNARRQQAAAAHGDVTAFVRTLDVAQALHAKIDEVGRRLGFRADSPCGRYFG